MKQKVLVKYSLISAVLVNAALCLLGLPFDGVNAAPLELTPNPAMDIRTRLQPYHLDNAIDLWAYASNTESPGSDLTLTMDNTPNPNAGVPTDINSAPDWAGQTDIAIRVTGPGGLSDTDTFSVDVSLPRASNTITIYLPIILNNAGPTRPPDWTHLPTGITETLEAVHFVDAQTGWVAGTAGAIFHTTDGGQSWQRQDSGTTDELRDMFFLDLNRGWIVGGKRLILRTTDGGNTWETQECPPDEAYLHAIHFADEDHGWIAGGRYTVSGWPYRFRAYGYVFKSTDGGDSWFRAAYIPYRYALDLYSVDATRGWLVAEYIDNSTYNTIPQVYVTSDGGSTWTNQSIPVSIGGLGAVTFVDANMGWIVGDGGLVLHTTNGGALWNQQESGATDDLDAVQFVSPTTGWIVGPILHTTDGGETWASQSADSACTGLRDLHFVDIDHGWAVGANGVVCKYH